MRRMESWAGCPGIQPRCGSAVRLVESCRPRSDERGLHMPPAKTLEHGLLHVRQALAPDGKSFSQPKTAKGRRRIRLTPEAVDALKRHLVAQNEQ